MLMQIKGVVSASFSALNKAKQDEILKACVRCHLVFMRLQFFFPLLSLKERVGSNYSLYKVRQKRQDKVKGQEFQ